MPILAIFISILVSSIIIFWGCNNHMIRNKHKRRVVKIHIDDKDSTTIKHWQLLFVILLGTVIFVESTELEYNVWIVSFIALLLGGLIESIVHPGE